MSSAYMFSRRALLLGGLVWWTAGCTGGSAGDLAYRVAVDGEGNQVDLYRDGDVVWVDVASARGIGAAFVYVPVAAPLNLRFRLHLSGLEQFRLWWGGRTVTASVSAARPGGSRLAVQVWSRTDDQPDTPITPESPNWLEITRSADGASFEIMPPPAWQNAQPTLFAIGWIDFFR